MRLGEMDAFTPFQHLARMLLKSRGGLSNRISIHLECFLDLFSYQIHPEMYVATSVYGAYSTLLFYPFFKTNEALYELKGRGSLLVVENFCQITLATRQVLRLVLYVKRFIYDIHVKRQDKSEVKRKDRMYSTLKVQIHSAF